ncbi:hypothetical protein Hanom_Chr14g01273341 [Helianthus anomalus]
MYNGLEVTVLLCFDSYCLLLVQEQLDGAGIELPSLYKWRESRTPNGCCTKALKNKTRWVGSQATGDATESIVDAEKYLQTHSPVQIHHGTLLEEGASGFLGKRLAPNEDKETNCEVDWSSFNVLCSSSINKTSVGSKDWASVYLASTPQAAQLGLNFPFLVQMRLRRLMTLKVIRMIHLLLMLL